jgi:hypothetical protein
MLRRRRPTLPLCLPDDGAIIAAYVNLDANNLIWRVPFPLQNEMSPF